MSNYGTVFKHKGNLVYVQKFGRIARSRNPAFIHKKSYDDVERCLPECECRGSIGGPPGVRGHDGVSFSDVVRDDPDKGVAIPDCDNPNAQAWIVQDFDNPELEWVIQDGIAKSRRAAQHSLNDGNRDSAWRNLGRSLKKCGRNFRDGFILGVKEFFDEFGIVIKWLAMSAFFTAIVMAMLEATK